MPGARSLFVVFSVSMLGLAACASITPVAPASPTSPVASAPVAVASEPATLPTGEPPTDAPVDTPTEQPSQTEPPEPGDANLVITKLTFDINEPVPGEEIEAQLTLRNAGGTEASTPRSAILGVTSLGSDDVISMADFPGLASLAPGNSVKVTTTFSLPAAGSYSVYAIADPDDTVVETSDDDNRKDVQLDTLSAPNLAFVDKSFLIAAKDADHGYYAAMRYTNTGTAVLDQPFSVQFFYFTQDGAQGEFGTFDVPQVTIQPGEAVSETFEFTVEPGSYLGYALLDPTNAVVEMDETDNEARYDFTAP